MVAQHGVDRLAPGRGRIQLGIDDVEIHRTPVDAALGIDLVHRELNAGQILTVGDLERPRIG